MEEINLKELFIYFKEKLTLILIIILTILIGGCLYSLLVKTPLYRSESSIALVSENTKSSSDVQLNKSLVKSYSKVVKSRRVVEQVIENLSLDYSISKLTGRVNVTAEDDTAMLTITAADENPETATTITNEIVKVFKEEIKSIYGLNNVAIVDTASETSTPYNVNILKDIMVYIIVGVVLSLAVVFVIYYFDSTIKSSEEIENKLKLPIFGVVPKVKEK